MLPQTLNTAAVSPIPATAKPLADAPHGVVYAQAASGVALVGLNSPYERCSVPSALFMRRDVEKFSPSFRVSVAVLVPAQTSVTGVEAVVSVAAVPS